MTKAEAFDNVLAVAEYIQHEDMCTDAQKLTKLLGTIHGCMACIDPDYEEDDRK